ncbi:hypothetical protein M0802_002081 [Mischocyttarus mexicanus]|nr:hypothetical protein M0802_002081 [Mischocyttarus mexicanus]
MKEKGKDNFSDMEEFVSGADPSAEEGGRGKASPAFSSTKDGIAVAAAAAAVAAWSYVDEEKLYYMLCTEEEEVPDDEDERRRRRRMRMDVKRRRDVVAFVQRDATPKKNINRTIKDISF